ncbi:DUF1835 domain-containing protein [Paenibacillus soyae]|uniref:DUF1835 domain-containing protein n=1 Tax=Paenibacillus soyae TaxID=2969249 RepID=A0A9X2S981_9BACL|nr:DUF1835 domain-containing protein [Paenibacillus soyae]MCR2805189.1 DUF1835 domain-containing protein [Paenibacillus soyae]
MLHLVNGDVVGEKLKRAGVEGDILVWREIYTHGPAFAEMEKPAHRKLRADYLEETLGIPQAEYLRFCEQQERWADEFQGEIVLWFEHDLFDQTMLSLLLHRYERLGAARGQTMSKLSLICIGEYPGKPAFRGLGELEPSQLAGLLGSRIPVSDGMLRLGSRLWEAYASSEPAALMRLLESDTSTLPYADAAFRAHLARLPSSRNGLGSIEQATLEAVASGIGQPIPLFQEVSGRLSLLGLGDLEYWHWLSGMIGREAPLLEPLEEAPLRLPGYGGPAPDFSGAALRMTALGQDVLAGRMDWLEYKERTEWLGGVCVRTSNGWRWDAENGFVIKAGFGQ